MNLMEHTKGPWKVIRTQMRALQWNIGTALGAPRAAVICEGLNNRDGNAEANARLMAMAPTMETTLMAVACNLTLAQAEGCDLGGYGRMTLEAVNNVLALLAKETT